MRPALESDICKKLVLEVRYLQQLNQLPKGMMLMHIPNEQRGSNNKLRDMLYGKHLKLMGLIPGAPDYCIWYAGGKVAWLEMKRDKTCKQSKNQKEFEQLCIAMETSYLCTYEIDKALEFIKLNAAIQ